MVIGGGIAGTLAAWALRGHAARVLVVERGTYPAAPDFRDGVPQGRHAHLLLEGGHRALEAMMPGIRAELAAAGAVSVRMSGDHGLRWLSSAGWMAPHATDLAFLSCTRPVIDHVVRARLYDESAVRTVDGTDIEFLQNAAVVGLLGDARAVSGVRIRTRGHLTESRLSAELVVDASGRRSLLSTWLTELGFSPIPTEIVDAHVAYRTRLVHRQPDPDCGFTALYLQASRSAPFTGVLLPVEGDRWIVSLGAMGRGREPAPGTAGFEHLLTQLRDPLLREVLRDAEPASGVRGFRPGPSMRRHLEHRYTPAGIVALGDAATTLNPVYGQGITVAARSAQALRAAVERHHGIGHAAARAARQAIAATSRDAWLMSSAEDARYTGVPTGPLIRTQHRLLDRVLDRVTSDVRVTAAFERVMSLVAPPTALLHPSILASVLAGSR
ncbi:NAD(P)-binding protein [Nocardia terpenica]|uniref:NAD(P)-binding protein n=1 Tax=Nocardia terpenica TaxID=455432 RepID=A0A6G9ZH44_9NOCA|nr:NAD(P)-binding protein [Nocardia terpenica]